MTNALTSQEFQIQQLKRGITKANDEILDYERRLDNMVYWFKLATDMKTKMSRKLIEKIISDRGRTDRPKLVDLE